MSAATFPCPHCGITYPFKPVLVGRTVRCTSCKKAFRLRAEGIADPVEQTPLPEQRPDQGQGESQGAAPSSPSQRRATERIQLSGRQLEQRRSMAASLTSAIGKALQGEAPPPPAPGQRPARQRSSRMFAPQGDGKRKPGPAVLTGEGEREAANLRAWTVGAIAVLALLVTLGWLLSLHGPRRAALAEFTALVTGPDNAYGRRAEAIRARAWLSAERPGGAGVAPFIELGDTSLGNTVRIPGGALGEALERTKGLTWSDPPGAWTSDPAAARLAAANGLDALLAKAVDLRLTVVEPRGLAKRLAGDGLDEDSARLVVALLMGETAPGRNAIAERARKALPERIEWCAFSGANGLMLIDTGSSYQTRQRPYRGVLVRFLGGEWPGEWRILTLAPAAP